MFSNGVIFETIENTRVILDWRNERAALPRNSSPVAIVKDGEFFPLWEGQFFSNEEIEAACNYLPVEKEIPAEQPVEYAEKREWKAGVFRDPFVVTVAEAAEIASVSEQAVRDVLRDDERLDVIFPGAYRTSSNPQRGEWRIPRAEVEAWQPRKYPR